MTSEEGKTPAPVLAPQVPAAVPVPQGPISIDDFKRIQLRVGVIVEATDHPKADRLLVLKVDIGDGQTRQVVAGIKGAYQVAELVGKRVVVVANLQPAMLRGVESQGMVLAASDATQLSLVILERAIQAGSPVK